MLDVIVGGCNYGFLVIVRATQPDTVDPGAPPPGAGGAYWLSTDANHHVNTCRDRNNVVVNLDSCLAAAAYSSFFLLATDRIIPK